jgi:uncharacterized protein YbjQ (UPF0145 family)
MWPKDHPRSSEQALSDLQVEAEINSIMLTTETAMNLNITKRIEIVTAECAFGMNMFKDLFAGVRNIVGGRSEAVQKTMRDARRTALYELKKSLDDVAAKIDQLKAIVKVGGLDPQIEADIRTGRQHLQCCKGCSWRY